MSDAIEQAARVIAKIEGNHDGDWPDFIATAQALHEAGMLVGGEPVAWRELDPMIDPGHSLPMLVCRHHAAASYGPALAFMDVAGTWRVAGSSGGSAPLAWTPTHCAPAPSIWPLPTPSEGK